MGRVAGYAEGFGAEDADVEGKDRGSDEDDGDGPGHDAHEERLQAVSLCFLPCKETSTYLSLDYDKPLNRVGVAEL